MSHLLIDDKNTTLMTHIYHVFTKATTTVEIRESALISIS